MSQKGDFPAKSELAAALRGYLPSSLERQCLLGDEIRAPDVCAQHLAALLHTVTTYLPDQVVGPLLKNPQSGRVEGRFSYGTVMFADISGFTAMSEKLSQLGKEGAEEVTRIINLLFTTLLEVSDQYGGDLLKFGGDALLVYFGGEDHAFRACLAALRMQETMLQFSETSTSQGVFQLRMSVGLGTGRLFMASLGSEEGMEFAVMGRAMGNMARAEAQASAEEIFIDTATYQAIIEHATTEPTPDGFHQLFGFREDLPDLSSVPENPVDSLPPPPVGEDAYPWVVDTVQRIRALELFLPPGLMDKIKVDPERIAIGGEYRPVTVFFANFYGIDEIIEELGEERTAEITAILNTHFTTMRQIITKYGGVVNKVDTYAKGHRIMTLFGAPRAHIDDPEQAVRAAMEMQDAMAAFADLETSRGTFSLKQRIGVNTGLVFAGNVGSLTHQEYSVMGDGVNLAARLMAVATEGQVVISQSTARQSGDAFLLHEQEPVRVKGKSLPVHNFEVLGLQERRVRERRPLIGRDEEWEKLHDLTELALAGDMQVLTLVGDAGLGKSRLVEEMTGHWIEEHGALSISTTCPSFGRHTPYLPWLDLLRSLFGFNPADSDQVRLEKIEALLLEIDPTWHDWTVLIGRLLGLDVEETDLIRALDAQTRQRMTFNIVIGLVNHVANERPLLLAIDDLQWADDTSVELVSQVARQATDQPLLLVLAHRLDEALASTLKLSDLVHHTDLRLKELSLQASLDWLDTLLPTTPQMPQRFLFGVGLEFESDLRQGTLSQGFRQEFEDQKILLSPNDLITIVMQEENYRWRIFDSGLDRVYVTVKGSDTLDIHSQPIKDLILNKAQGNPLFIEEVARSLIENYLTLDEETGTYSARTDLEQIEVPDSVNRVIMSRIDRLDESSRNVLKVASVIGQEFEHWLLSAIYPYRRAEGELQERLDELSQREILEGPRPELLYLFRHIMSREVAYESLLYADRRQLHRRIGESIETQRTGRLTEYLEILADHFDLAEEWKKALDYHLDAGHKAQSIYANEDAIYRFQKALKAAERVAGSEAKQLLAHVGLSEVFDTLGRYDEALTHIYRAQDLVMVIGHAPEQVARDLADLCRRAAQVHEKRSEFDIAFNWVRGGLIALEGMHTVEEAQLYLKGVGIYHRQGNNTQALEWCERTLDIAGQLEDVGEERLKILAHTYFILGSIYIRHGDWSRVLDVCRNSLLISEQIGDIAKAGQAHLNMGTAYFEQGNWPKATEHYLQDLEIKRRIGDVYGQAFVTVNLGGVYLDQGDLDQAIKYFHQSLEMWERLGSTYVIALLHNNMADVALRQGNPDAALTLLEKSLDMFEQVGSGEFLPEVYRHLAETRLERGELKEALSCGQRSLKLAQEGEMRQEEGETRRVVGQIYLARQELAKAEEELNESLRILEELESHYEVGKTLFQLARLHRMQGDQAQMWESLKRALAIFENLGARLDLAQARELSPD
jgi:class 3 adenylate cyclase/tetratricopeptide (TPR) repeat protein